MITKTETKAEIAERRNAWLKGTPGVYLTNDDLRLAEDVRDSRPRPSGNIVGNSMLGKTVHQKAAEAGGLLNSRERYDVATESWVPYDEDAE